MIFLVGPSFKFLGLLRFLLASCLLHLQHATCHAASYEHNEHDHLKTPFGILWQQKQSLSSWQEWASDRHVRIMLA